MKRASSVCAASIPFLLLAAPLRADSVEEVKKKIHDKWAAYKSVMMKFTTATDTDMGGTKMKVDSVTTMEYVNKGGNSYQSRMDTTSKSITNVGGEEKKTDSKLLAIFDGTMSYTYTEAEGMKQAFKSKAEPGLAYNPFDQLALFKQQEAMYELKMLPDETVNGKSCWVMELTPKDPSFKAFTSKVVVWYEKSTAMSLKSVTYDSKGKASNTQTLTDYKTDHSIPADRFVFTPPPGVEVIDQSGGRTPAAAGGGAEKPAEGGKSSGGDKPAGDNKPAEEKKPGGLKIPKLPKRP